MSSAEETRQALIDAALHLFGHQGYAATTTRAIAARAGANLGSIAYHFGGKADLRLACAKTVADRIDSIIGSRPEGDLSTPEQAEAALAYLLRAMAGFLTSNPVAEDMVTFILRELSERSEVVDVLYDTLIEQKHREFCRLWGLATGQDAESDKVKLAVFAMIGQLVYFRIGRPVVLRRMGWHDPGREEARQVTDILLANLHASLAAERM